MRRRWILGAALLLLMASGLLTPLVLRHVGFFRVRRVELLGVRYLTPDSVLVALALRPGQNVFDDRGAMEGRASSLPGVVNVKIERRLPGTLRISVLEREPVVFIPGFDHLVAFDGEGRALPYDPAATGLDLPVISKLDTMLVRTLSVIRLADSSLYQDVDGAIRGPRGGVILEVGAGRVLLDGVPAADEVRTIGAVRRHLGSTGRRYAEMDARYEGWVVVRRSTT